MCCKPMITGKPRRGPGLERWGSSDQIVTVKMQILPSAGLLRVSLTITGLSEPAEVF